MITNGYIPITNYEIKKLDLHFNINKYFETKNNNWKKYYKILFKNFN